MSALDDLIARLQRDLYKPERHHLRTAELEAMTFYNRIRHEAAEEIRAWVADPMSCAGAGEYGDRENVSEAADRIDPEVTE